MCGIAGLAGADAVRHEHTVGAMGATQAHRGPDGTLHAAAADGRAVLAMNTLLIVDPQAMPGPYLDRESGVLLAFNGEILEIGRHPKTCFGTKLFPRRTDRKASAALNARHTRCPRRTRRPRRVRACHGIRRHLRQVTERRTSA